MRHTVLTYCAYAVGAAVISLTSVVIYQQVTPVQVVQVPAPVVAPPPPAVPEPLPEALLKQLEPMPTEPFTPAGRFLSMPKPVGE